MTNPEFENRTRARYMLFRISLTKDSLPHDTWAAVFFRIDLPLVDIVQEQTATQHSGASMMWQCNAD